MPLCIFQYHVVEKTMNGLRILIEINHATVFMLQYFVSFSAAHPCPDCGGHSLRREIKEFHQLLRGGIRTFPSQPRDIISPVRPWSALRSPSGWAYLKHLPRETSRRHPDQKSEHLQLVPLNVEEQQLYSELCPDIQALARTIQRSNGP